MGDDLYAEVVPADRLDVPCRVYAPVGSHEDLLPYLVRRLLENGANSSFVNRITDESVAIDDLVHDPVEIVDGFDTIPHPRIPLPRDVYRSQAHDIADERDNSMGLNLANDAQLRALAEQLNAAVTGNWRATAARAGRDRRRRRHRRDQSRRSPRTSRHLARRRCGDGRTGAAQRGRRASRSGMPRRPPRAPRSSNTQPTLLEARMPQFMALCTKEAGKTIPDGVAEVREAVDFLRYYAGQARKLFAHPEKLPGPTGESNELHLQWPRRVRLHLAVEFPARDLRSARSPRRSPPATA